MERDRMMCMCGFRLKGQSYGDATAIQESWSCC
jgi:hypothetical protein